MREPDRHRRKATVPAPGYLLAACKRGGNQPDVLCQIMGVRGRLDLPATTFGQLPGTGYHIR